MEYIVSILSLIFGAVICAAFLGARKTRSSDQLRELEMLNRQLEKSIHIKEREFLEEKNKIELSHLRAMKETREAARREGFEQGLAEREKDHIVSISEIRAQHNESLRRECELAADEARSKLRAEMEMQTKMFSVSIRPYVKIQKDGSWIKKKHMAKIGYQYQLLINGIPAFQPHVVVEREERIEELDKENIKMMVQVAAKAAQAALEVYLGGAPLGMIRMQPELIEGAVVAT